MDGLRRSELPRQRQPLGNQVRGDHPHALQSQQPGEDQSDGSLPGYQHGIPAEQREPLVITQNGEAKAVLQDVASFEETQETLAMLKILALGNQDVAAGKVKPAADVVTRLRAKRA